MLILIIYIFFNVSYPGTEAGFVLASTKIPPSAGFKVEETCPGSRYTLTSICMFVYTYCSPYDLTPEFASIP